VRQVEEIRGLHGLGLSVQETRPFVECLADGHLAGDECPESLAAYRHAIDQLSERITRLARRRDALATHLAAYRHAIDQLSERITRLARRRDALATHLEMAATRAMPPSSVTDLTRLPDGLPVPGDDGAAAHLIGLRLPAMTLPSTDGSTVRLDALGEGRTVLYVYPLTGRPWGRPAGGWDNIPGARGCTPEACGFRDHHDDLRAAGAERVYGLSSQPGDYQRELVDRLHLPFAMLSDPEFTVRNALGLPTFVANSISLYRRLTMIIDDSLVEHVFYPVFPPDRHAEQVVDWLHVHLRSAP
jgi:peroxiredoxin